MLDVDKPTSLMQCFKNRTKLVEPGTSQFTGPFHLCCTTVWLDRIDCVRTAVGSTELNYARTAFGFISVVRQSG